MRTINVAKQKGFVNIYGNNIENIKTVRITGFSACCGKQADQNATGSSARSDQTAAVKAAMLLLVSILMLALVLKTPKKGA